MTNLTTIVRVYDRDATLEHVENYRSYRPYQRYDYTNFDRHTMRVQAYAAILVGLIIVGATVLERVAQ